MRLREETRNILLRAAQEEISELVKLQEQEKLCKEELREGLHEIRKYLDAIPIHSDGGGDGGGGS